MIMNNYVLIVLVILGCIMLNLMLEYSKEKVKERMAKILEVLNRIFNKIIVIEVFIFVIYNVVIIVKGPLVLKIMSIIFLVAIIFTIIESQKKDSEKVDIISWIFLFSWVVWIFFLIVLIFIGKEIKLDKENIVEENEITKIKEFEETSKYIIVIDERNYYYICAEDFNNSADCILDAIVEIDESYKENPHIEKYQKIEKYIDLWGEEREKIQKTSNTICIPENAILSINTKE